jgi:hypothetical protein
MKWLLLLMICHLSATPILVPTHRYANWPDTRDLAGMDPFIGHLSFRNICDHIIDQSTACFDPDTVRQGDLIYLNLWYLDWFIDHVHDQIPHPYILVSGDIGAWYPVTERKKFLYDPKLAAWFCRNMVFSYHPKLFQLPMGQDLHLFDLSNEGVLELLTAQELKSQVSKDHLLYMNFYRRGHGDRDAIFQFFSDKPYCFTVEKGIERDEYYRQMASSKFALSPLGLETDSVRTWEAFALDCIPIVENTFNDPIYEGMPIFIVDDWTKIDEHLLVMKYEELKNLSREKAYFPYWRKLIKETQEKVQKDDLAFTQLEATLFLPDEIETIRKIMKKRSPNIFYKGFLSTLRPIQLSEQEGFSVALYDPWLDPETLQKLCETTYFSNRIFLFSSEEWFKESLNTVSSPSIFLDFTYYRTSLSLNFEKSICTTGNFRHSLKSDLDRLIDDLPCGALVFGNRAEDPYVEKVLHQLLEEQGIKIERAGAFWSYLKEDSTLSSTVNP